MVYQYLLNGNVIKTGDIICTTDGDENLLPGQFWRLIGLLIPGDVDHVAIYIGPDGNFIESGPNGVIEFSINKNIWNAEKLTKQRGPLIDKLYGIAYPFFNKILSIEEEYFMRESIYQYCLKQIGKSYNINFLDSDTESAFYCSQLIYKAYLSIGINLNSSLNITRLPGTEIIVFPEDIWNSSYHIKV
jgi:hypothetical protein